MNEGVRRIAVERERQIHEKGFSREHDRTEHADGSLGDLAGMVLAAAIGGYGPDDVENDEDRVAGWCAHILAKHTGYLRRLEIAGALIAAEIDRLLADTVTT